MNQRIKKLWIKALRSGDYNQGENFLNIVKSDGTETHCCLGVLCELASIEGIVTRRMHINHASFGHRKNKYSVEDCEHEIEFLPKEVMDWAELDSEDPFVEFNNEQSTLANLNDTNQSFKKIADVIEEQL